MAGRHQLRDMEKLVQGIDKALARLTASVVE
jgi:hypothetical protein